MLCPPGRQQLLLHKAPQSLAVRHPQRHQGSRGRAGQLAQGQLEEIPRRQHGVADHKSTNMGTTGPVSITATSQQDPIGPYGIFPDLGTPPLGSPGSQDPLGVCRVTGPALTRRELVSADLVPKNTGST